MPRSDDIYKLPEDLLIPENTGEADHLEGMLMPDITLSLVNFSNLKGISVIFIYPRTGRPDKEPPAGWNKIAGARGCTPQNINFNENYQNFCERHVNVWGLSSQDESYQAELKSRLELQFDLISDKELQLKELLKLPTFKVEDMELYKRLTIVLKDNKIIKTFFPVFPPDKNASEVLEYVNKVYESTKNSPLYCKINQKSK